MAILVTGATGRVDRQVVHQLVNRSTDVCALVRDPSKADFPASVNVVQGDILDIESLRCAFAGVRALFLLNVVIGDEFTQVLLALNVTRESGIERAVYLSAIHTGHFVNVPHFTAKFGTEYTIEQIGSSITVLRPAYFMDNEYMMKDIIVNHGVYPMPISSKGATMVGTRDIAGVTAIELVRRDATLDKLPTETIDLMDSDTLTDPELASIWSETLGHPVAYDGNDPNGSETNLTNFLPKRTAYEMRLVAECYVSDGMVLQAGDVEHLIHILGRPLGTYRDFTATPAQRDARGGQVTGGSLASACPLPRLCAGRERR